MKVRISTLSWIVWGGFLMLLAFASVSITLVSGDYRGALVAAIAFGVLSAACLAVPMRRGPLTWRVIAGVLALPLVFVAMEILRRGPHVFFHR